jgi:tetratricopeptide (TPR) repeat protein
MKKHLIVMFSFTLLWLPGFTGMAHTSKLTFKKFQQQLLESMKESRDDTTTLHGLMISMLADSGHTEAVDSMLKVLLKKHPRDKDLHKVAMVLWIAGGRLADAIKEADWLVRALRYDHQLFAIRGMLHFFNGNDSKAFDDLTRSDLNYGDNRYFLSQIQRQNGYPGLALKELTKAIASNPAEGPHLYMERAWAFADLRDTDAACRDYRKALSMGYEPDDEEKTVCTLGED